VNVSSIGGASLDQLASLGVTGVPAAGAAAAPNPPASVSPLAQALSELQQLGATDPARLKTVLSDVADKLQAAGEQEGGTTGQVLSSLAGKVRQAAQTGDLSSLRPSAAHHHHHHHHGAAAYQQASAVTAAPATQPGATGDGSQPTDVLNDVVAAALGGTPAGTH